MKLYRYLLCSFLISTVVAVFLLILTGLKFTNDTVESSYKLKAYKNTVALYKNNEMVEVYEDVVLSNLPEGDRISLGEGIEFKNMQQVRLALQDYDG